MTYKNAENLRESIKILPLKNLLIETDAPYLSPQ
ncbi:TatD family hydrolase [bacterium]|nr:TatD family hydrolase [bacterium]